jgi:hypothetical protein
LLPAVLESIISRAIDRPVNVETTVLLKGPTIKRSGSPPSVKHDCITVLMIEAVNAR